MTAFDAHRESSWRRAFTIVSDGAGVFVAAVVAAGVTVAVAVFLLVAAQEMLFQADRSIEDIQASVFLRAQTARADAEALKHQLDELPFVSAATLRTREDASAALEAAGLAQVRGRPNPLPDVWVVNLRVGGRTVGGVGLSERVSAAREALSRLPGVDSVDVDLRWTATIERWNAVVTNIHSAGIRSIFVIASLLLFCLYFLAGRGLDGASIRQDPGVATPRASYAIVGALAGTASLLIALSLVAGAGAIAESGSPTWKPIAARAGQMSGVSLGGLCVLTLFIAITALWLGGRRR